MIATKSLINLFIRDLKLLREILHIQQCFKVEPNAKKIAHSAEDIFSTEALESSSSVVLESSSFKTLACVETSDNEIWNLPIDMSFPDITNGTTDNNHKNFTGMGFYNIANKLSSFAEYNITSDKSAENTRVMIRYSNGGKTNRNMKFKIDNGEYEVEFLPTLNWDT